MDAIVRETMERYRNSIPRKAVLELVEKLKAEVRTECSALNYGRKYYEEHKEERRAYQRRYYEAHREYYQRKCREYRAEHKEEIREKRREKRKKEEKQ